jgi:hypothetical protein
MALARWNRAKKRQTKAVIQHQANSAFFFFLAFNVERKTQKNRLA